MNHYLYCDVKVIKTGKIGMVIDVSEDSVYIQFGDGTMERQPESDIIIVNGF